ncbi:hypothetical protein HQ346_24540 [Rhodococcus sp. BP-252]|uniref:Uncharacterized protein n=1 Tax=Rhodococcoides kyotonense TaxID=398843 RepID=A0A177YKK4_9NOCA|nr:MULTISPECIES: hypothetical protein [Rhodococcus]MBY6414772.1 hypothetical protein [Rhodococcus sp. BP-320]MBY6419676.1 hypothetical protein [Rhodococcus sp. BP-321]MBY6424653.1 hypothetical protein [Rhodococcus sp. BP-324]MBY6429650.1 hypothetical protein [Rhodococcus sp. BP-323]MBY6434628.1 hypothetical protein [Rhodococcus sp. BP-322]
MKPLARSASAIAAAVIAILVGFGLGSVAHANPAVDPVSALQEAGVPTEVAVLAAQPTLVAGGVDTVSFESRGDAVVDHAAQRVTVTLGGPSVHIGWANLRTGDAGISDRAGVLPTGAGPVVIVVYGDGGPGPTAALIRV